MSGVDLSDVLYPECHLDSPIVTGKLIQIVMMTNLPHNQPLNDDTLIRNILVNKQKNKKTVLKLAQDEFNEYLIKNNININKINHIPYPNGNKELFRMTEHSISAKLMKLMKIANSCYDKISKKIISLKHLVENQLGLSDKSQNFKKDELYNENSILKLSHIIEGSKWYFPFLFWFAIKTDMRELIKNNKRTVKRMISKILVYDTPKYYIQMNRNLLLIVDKFNYYTHYLTFEMVLMMSDVTEGRLMIETAMSSDLRLTPIRDRGIALWELIDSFFANLGNDTYNIVAMIEPLTLGYLQLNDKSPILRGAFLKYALDELIAEFKSHGYTDDEDLIGIVDAVNSIFLLDDIHITAEFFSFFRTFGHPTLEAADAAKKVREHMNKPKLLNFKTMMKGHALFCGIIINGYRDRHGGSWPQVDFPPHCSKKIKNIMNNNESLTDEVCINEWKSFVGIKFGCFMSLTLDEDLTMYMKDKALAALKSEWDSVYPPECMRYNPPNQTTSRRLVEVFLNDSDFDPVNLINYVINGDYLRDEDFNLSYSLKEKEIKKVGRLFAKMTYKMRACQVVAESLIATGVGKFFKENGMAKDEHELLKTLHKLSVSSVPRDNKINNRVKIPMSRVNKNHDFDDYADLDEEHSYDNYTKISDESNNKNTRGIYNQLTDELHFDNDSLIVDNLNYPIKFRGTACYDDGTPITDDEESNDDYDYHDPLFNKGDDQSYYNINYNCSNIKNKSYDNKNKENIQYETISTFLTTDLQKFCLNWRQESSNIFAERLNEIYGLPGFFNWMHKRLEKSVLYVADPHCPPYNKEHMDLDDVENDQIFVKYPMGGIEGYCQKLWTIITIPFLFLSAYEVGSKIAAVVQGDNQAIAITKRVHPNLPFTVKKIKSTKLAQKYFNQLRINLDAIGHNLKANETIVSSHFFVYSKRIYYDGLVLSQSLKPISRAVFWSETIVDETRSACSNISTAISKSIEQGFHRWIGYSINVLKVLQQLIISLKYTINPSMTHDITEPLLSNQSWLISASILPSQLGGFNYLNICRLYVRNIGDPVTASIADVKRMISVKLFSPGILQKIMHQKRGKSDFLDWASDPYSINIPSSQSVTVILKNITARTILSNSDNPMLKGLFHFDFDQEDRDLARFLLDRPVILPRAAHEIMDNSLTGARQEIAGMLDTTKGLIRNSIRMGGLRPKLVDKLSLYDYEQFRVFNDMMSNKLHDNLIDVNACSVHLAAMLRKIMWFPLSQGRPIYGLEVPDSIEVIKGVIIRDHEDCEYCDSGNKEYGWFFIPSHCELDKVSKESNKMRIPYFGSTTDERSEIKLSNVRSPSRALRAAVRIAMVYTWAYGDNDQSWEEAWYLASFRANVTIDELKAITPISTSNNIAHRLRDKSTQMKYSGSSLNRVGRYTVISNDNLNFIIDGSRIDTNLIYQQIMLMGISILEDSFRYVTDTGSKNTLMHLHINTKCCIIEMNDHPYIESENILPQLQGVDNNKLIYDPDPIVHNDQERIHNQIYRKNLIDFPNWSLDQLNECLCQSLSMTIIEIITKENKDHMSEFKVLALEDDVNSLITEFLLVNPSQLSLYLGLYISINWSFDIYYRRPEGKYQMVEFLNSILITTSKNNLSVLANALSHPIVFDKFWNSGLIEPIYGPNVSSQDFNRISIDLLTTSYMTYINYWMDFDEVEYLITESDEQIVDQRYEITQARHLCFISSIYLNRSEMPIIRGLTSIEKCQLIDSKIREQKILNQAGSRWHTDILQVMVVPSSLTYMRRGSVKHIKLRNYISAEAFGYEKLLSINAQPKLFEMAMNKITNNETEYMYFPVSALNSSDFEEFDFKVSPQNSDNLWESHIKRRIGLNSTSCYKALEICKFILDKINPRGNRLFLGEGSGSMMATYYTLLGPAKTFFNTGVSSGDTRGQRILSLIPSEYTLVAKNNPDDSNMMSDLHVLFNGKPESTWIGDMSCFQYIMNHVDYHSCDLIHNDMESSMEKDPETIMIEQLHSLSLALNLGNENSIYITKLAPRSDDYTEWYFSLIQTCYSEVIVFIPASSNPRSSELYLIMRGKLINTLILPDYFVDELPVLSQRRMNNIADIICNIKITRSIEIEYNEETGESILSNKLRSLTEPEKILMSNGFRLNGPKNVKRLIGHDISTGGDNLIENINISLNHIINYFDSSRESIPFFDPFPLNEDSKIREMMEMITKKVLVYSILYGGDDDDNFRNFNINNLKKKSMFIDFNTHAVKRMLKEYLYRRLRTSQIKRIWSFKLSTCEIKVLWKIVGYSYLLM
uniref:RNA-directed RNA polymerase L n=1 Tax=Otomops bat paramyxovirus TaxID=3141897 RepID=A0AAU7E346_9MONO